MYEFDDDDEDPRRGREPDRRVPARAADLEHLAAGIRRDERKEQATGVGPHGERPLRRWQPGGAVGLVLRLEACQDVADPHGDEVDGRWSVPADVGVTEVLATWRQQAEVTDAVLRRHDLDEVGRPGPRWEGAEPATLERVVLHVMQEYARHLGHLDIVAELGGGVTGEA